MHSPASITPMHTPFVAPMRRSAAWAVRACVPRRQRVPRHGVPSAFVSLSGVTAMLSTAVRQALT